MNVMAVEARSRTWRPGLWLLIASSAVMRRWQLFLGLFLVWLMVEDLVRKMLGNDLRIYFIKDGFYALLLLSVFLSPDLRGAWRAATGNVRFFLYAFMAWAVFTSVPLLPDWRLPVLGLRLDFLYVPLVVVGFLLARDRKILARALLLISLLGASASALGIIQAVVGPRFLSPGVPTPGLMNLILIRANGSVYRPTGTFVDPGRFDSMAVLAVAIGLAAVMANRGIWRVVAAASVLISMAAVWVSGGRAGLIQGVALLCIAVIALALGRGRSTLMATAILILTVVTAALALRHYFPKLVSSRLAFYWSTLNPKASTNQWAYQWHEFTSNMRIGVHLGGLMGMGTGTQSIGKQYLFGGGQYSTNGLYLLEGGYATVLAEFGEIGLALWLLWTTTWVFRQFRSVWGEREERFRTAGLVLSGWVFIFIFISLVFGFQSYQNYLTNAYFWLLSGVVFGLYRVSARGDRLKVWVVTPELHRHGGTERCIAEQVERWSTHFDLRVYTMKIAGVDLNGVAVRRIPWVPGPHLVRYIWWFAANSAARWLARLTGPAPDLVYSPGVNGTGLQAMSVHIVFAKHWAQVQSTFSLELRRRATLAKALHRLLYWSLVRWLERRTYSGTATIWALSRQDARAVEAMTKRPIGSVPSEPYGVDAAWFSPYARLARRAAARKRLGLTDERICLLIGNDAYKKGVDTAIAALADLPADVCLAVAGGIEKEALVGWATAHGLLERVLLWPHSSFVLEYYAAADVVVAPSREDAFHLPGLEALACGLPLVLSGRAGVAELLEDGKHALILANPEDSNELSAAIRRILEDPGFAEGLGRNGRALAQQWTWDGNAERAAALLHKEAETPRVLVLAPDPTGLGGVQLVTRTLLNSLGDLYGRERVGLLQVWDHGANPDDYRLLHRGAATAGKPTGRVGFVRRVAYLLAAIRHARRWKRNLVLVAAHPHLAPVAWLAAWVSGRPFVVWCHGLEAWGPMSLGVSFAIRNAAAVFTSNRFTAARVEDLARLAPGTVQVFAYGLPSGYEPAASNKEKQPTVLAVARLTPEDAYKGIDTLICAWPQVASRVPGAQLEIVGDGPDRPRLMKIADTLSLNGNVHFAGRVSDDQLHEAYGRATVFAMPGRHTLGPPAQGEGFGMVFVEAGAAGLPVVAGRAAGALDAVENEENGLLVDPNDPGDVANAIVRLLTDPELAARLGRGGQERAAGKFSYGVFKENLNVVVRSVAGIRTSHGMVTTK